MKYNLGCGFDYRAHWINVDRLASVAPDILHDLLAFPWPIPDDAADEILLSHTMEELFLSWPTCRGVLNELYRISKPGCIVTIRFHDGFNGAAPIRSGISVGFLESLDLARCEAAIAGDRPMTPHAIDLEIDFAFQGLDRILAEPWRARLRTGEIDDGQAQEAATTFNNVVDANVLTMKAVKPFARGRWLREMKALVVRRVGGLGDVLMALSALKAAKSVADIPIYLETQEAYASFAQLCPSVNGVFNFSQNIAARLAETSNAIKLVDWSSIRHGILHVHEVDSFLRTLGLTLPDAAKGLDIALPASERFDAISERLDALPPGMRVILHPGITDPNRTWDPAFWRQVAQHALARGCVVITIGRNAGHEGKGAIALDQDGVVDFADALDLEGTLHLMRQCDVLISGDAGPIQLAGATDIHIVGLYSVVSGHVRLPFRKGSRFHKATAIGSRCEFSPCYSYMPDDARLKQFCIEEAIAPTDIQTLFSRWCINPDRYACVRAAETLDRVKAEIDRLRQDTPRDPSTPALASMAE